MRLVGAAAGRRPRRDGVLGSEGGGKDVPEDGKLTLEACASSARPEVDYNGVNRAAELRLPTKGNRRHGSHGPPLFDSLHGDEEGDEAQLLVASALPGMAPIDGGKHGGRARVLTMVLGLGFALGSRAGMVRAGRGQLGLVLSSSWGTRQRRRGCSARHGRNGSMPFPVATGRRRPKCNNPLAIFPFYEFYPFLFCFLLFSPLN